MTTPPVPQTAIPLPTAVQQQVRLQLERLLRSSHFRNSKRYPALLRHIVEETLEGRGPGLKERTLGVEVFGRPADYDTASDPIVRVTIAEIRKRIAQYYHEDAHISELRIELTPGSYVPEFLPGREHEADQVPDSGMPALVALPVAPVTPVEPVELLPAVRRPRRMLPVLAVVAVALLVAAAAGAWFALRPSPMQTLWGPIFSESGPVTFCLPMSVRKLSPGNADTTDQAIAHALDLADVKLPTTGTFFEHQVIGENVVFSDVLAMMRLEPFIEQQHRPVRVRLNLATDLNDLREGPDVFIGGLSNQWTLKLIDPLRYRFGGNDATAYYIRDSQDPANQQWSVHLHDKMTTVNHDYAIIARVHSEPLGQVAMVVAGIGMTGTAAAGEFLGNPDRVRELERRIGRANRDHDFEAVLKTSVDNGIAGPAEIVALDVR